MALHELKVWPEYFAAIHIGTKTFELRKNDRGFKVGDELVLREYSPGPDEYTGRAVHRVVSYMIDGDNPTAYAFGLRTGFCILGFEANQ